MLITDELYELIVEETNRYAEELLFLKTDKFRLSKYYQMDASYSTGIENIFGHLFSYQYEPNDPNSRLLENQPSIPIMLS